MTSSSLSKSYSGFLWKQSLGQRVGVLFPKEARVSEREGGKRGGGCIFMLMLQSLLSVASCQIRGNKPLRSWISSIIISLGWKGEATHWLNPVSVQRVTLWSLAFLQMHVRTLVSHWFSWRSHRGRPHRSRGGLRGMFVRIQPGLRQSW